MRQETTPIPANDIKQVAWASMIGTTVEWYDFVIYSQAAALVFGPLFFPALSPALGTLAGFATFGIGFVARPIGAAIFGHFGDRVGRKTTLVTTLTLMGLATLGVGFLPTYAQVGLWAPGVLVALRLVQGFAVGGEWGGAVLMAVEHAPSHRRGFYGSWPQLGTPLSLIIATVVMTLLSASMSNDAFLAWGWRVPFLMSAVLVGVGLFIRLQLTESPEFLKLQSQGKALRAPIVDVWTHAKVHTLLVVGAQAAVNVGYYVVVVFGLSYATSNAGISRTAALAALIIGAFADLVAVPLFGALSDRLGRKPVLVGGSVFIGLFAFPFFLMVQSGSVVLLSIAVALGLALGHAPVYSTMSTFFSEGYGVRSRYSGLSIAYHLGGTVSSGPTPFVASALLLAYGGILPVIVLLGAAAALSVACLMLLRETRGRDLSVDSIAEDQQTRASVQEVFIHGTGH